MQHVWFQALTDPPCQSSSASPAPVTPTEAKNAPVSNKTNYLDHIIDQMIVQGIKLPKEHIQKILKNEVQQIEMRSDDEAANVKHEDRRVNDHHYIKATYQLLKDKSIRECKGINVHSSNLNYSKRGNIMKKANFKRSLDHGGGKALNEMKPKRATAAEIRAANLRQKAAAAAAEASLDVPQGNSFALPLARKCSIVSEEGSVCTEHNSFTETSMIPPEVILERRESDPTQPSHNNPTDENEVGINNFPAVNIFVTDSSASTENLASSIYCDYEKPVRKAFGLSGEPLGALHPVSSSPDFMNTHKLDEEENGDGAVSTDVAGEITHRRGSDIFIEEFGKLNHSRKINIQPLSAKALSTRLGPGGSNNGNTPSVRIIVQSKSMNNITLAERQAGGVNVGGTSGGGGVTSAGSEGAKMANSVSSVNIKQTKADKADCCAIGWGRQTDGTHTSAGYMFPPATIILTHST